MNVIDLDRVANGGEVRNLAGKPRGEHARAALGIDDLDQTADSVEVIVPPYIYGISSSFFLGLFSKSIVKFGDADKFLSHYRFDASDSVMRQVRHAIERGLFSRSAPE